MPIRRRIRADTAEGQGVAYLGCRLGTAPPPVAVYIRGPIKGYIYPDYSYYPIVTEEGQYPRFRVQGFRVRGLGV